MTETERGTYRLMAEDAQALKVLVFLLHGDPIGEPKPRPIARAARKAIIEEISTIATPIEPIEATYEKLNHLEYDGRLLMKAEIKQDDPDTDGVLEIEWKVDEKDLPYRTRGLVLAVVFRLGTLLGTPFLESDEETDEEPSLAEIERLALTLRLRPIEPPVQ